MKFIIDQDNHIHSRLSLCSNDPGQTPDAMLAYAKKNHLNQIVVTDHFWDERLDCHGFGFYTVQNLAHVRESLPLPTDPAVRFLFGCETDMDITGVIGFSDDLFDLFDFVIVPTTHMHFGGVKGFEPEDGSIEGRRKLWVSRIETLLARPLPENRVGLAHPTWGGLAPAHFEDHLAVLDGVPDGTMRALCQGLRDKKIGFELNFEPASYKGADLDRVLRLYRIAKEEGCKFYFGSDAHHPAKLEKSIDRFARIADILELDEDDKFRIAPRR